jgi:hypothetical protein
VTFFKIDDFFARKSLVFSAAICAKSKKSQTLSEAKDLEAVSQRRFEGARLQPRHE